MNKTIFVETLRIENGKVYNLEFHQARMTRTAFLHFGTKPELKIDVAKIPENLLGKRIKCRVLYSDKILFIEFQAYEMRKISSLQIVEDNNIEYEFKSVERSSLNKLFEQRKTADDIIIVKNGKITDTSFSNLVFEDFDSNFFTPKTYLLAGTKREFLLKNHIISEKNISIEDLLKYKKAYLINTMIDIEDNISVNVSKIRP